MCQSKWEFSILTAVASGRVDRIGQQAHNILCYSFLPAKGIERLLQLRARFRVYERLKNYAQNLKDTLFHTDELKKAIDEVYRYPLRAAAIDSLVRQLRSGVSDEDFARLVLSLRENNRLCITFKELPSQNTRIICSLSLIPTHP